MRYGTFMHGSLNRPQPSRFRSASSCLSRIGHWLLKSLRHVWLYTPSGFSPQIGPSAICHGGAIQSNHSPSLWSQFVCTSEPKTFLVVKAPDNLFGFLTTVLAGSAGRSVIIDRFWYHYRRGKFCRDDVSVLFRKPGYVIEAERPTTLDDFITCERLVGSPWQLNRNCLTELGKIWRK